jgi:carbonic anhydrase/acetyltransferase-like protein (isoleucine patch superfamily)
MGAIILDNAVIGEGSLIAAGAVVTPGTIIPPRSLAVGSPAKVIREIGDKQYEGIVKNSRHYVELAAEYRKVCYPAADKI